MGGGAGAARREVGLSSGRMGTNTLLVLVWIVLIGFGSCDQSSHQLGYPQEEVSAPLGYPIEGHTGATAGGYYSQYPSTAAGQYDYSLTYGDTDRTTAEVFSFPIVIVSFFSALLGGMMAPVVGRMPSADLDFLEFPVRKVSTTKKTRAKKGRGFDLSGAQLVAEQFTKFLKG